MESNQLKLQPELTNRFLQKLVEVIDKKKVVNLNFNNNYDPQKVIGYLETSNQQKFQQQQLNQLTNSKIQLVRAVKCDSDKYYRSIGLYFLETLFKFNQEYLADLLGQILREQLIFINDKSKQNKKNFIQYIAHLTKLFFFPQQSPEQFSNKVSQLLTNAIINNNEFEALLIMFIKSIIAFYLYQNNTSAQWFQSHSEEDEIQIMANVFRINIHFINDKKLSSFIPFQGENPNLLQMYLVNFNNAIYLGYTELHTQVYLVQPYEKSQPSLQSPQSSKSFYINESTLNMSQIMQKQMCQKCQQICNQSSLSCGHNLCLKCMINLFTLDLMKNDNSVILNNIQCQECQQSLITKDKIKFIS